MVSNQLSVTVVFLMSWDRDFGLDCFFSIYVLRSFWLGVGRLPFSKLSGFGDFAKLVLDRNLVVKSVFLVADG